MTAATSRRSGRARCRRATGRRWSASTRATFPWVMCWYPTPALAQEAGMTLGAVRGLPLRRGAARLGGRARTAGALRRPASTRADEVRIVGEGTDLRLSLAGRRMEVDAGMGNMPGGEFFGCPVETSAEGTIAFTEFPAVLGRPRGPGHPAPLLRRPGRRCLGGQRGGLPARDARHGRRARGASASSGSAATPASRGTCGNVYFDEKIDGTVHIALGFGFADLGGTNESADPLGHRQGHAPRRPDRARRRRRPGERRVDRVSP